MKPMRLAAMACALLLSSAAASASPPGRSATGSPSAGKDRDDRNHRLDRWTFGWFAPGLGFRCTGPGSFGSCRRPLNPYGYPYPYPNPYRIVLPPTGHEYLPDDWSFYLPAYELDLPDPYWARPPRRGPAPFALPSLTTCPEGVQRCHEDEPGVGGEEPR